MKCCVPGCVGDVASSGFPLPTAAVRRLKWLRIIKIPGGNFPEAKVCGKHFKPEDFETVEDYKSIEEKKVLKIDAVPTVFASGKPSKQLNLQSGASNLSQGFEGYALGSSPG